MSRALIAALCLAFLAAPPARAAFSAPWGKEEDKPRTPVVFADGLDRFFSVNSFPTVMVIDRAGKIAYRSDGFEPDTFEANLAAAVRRALAPQSTYSSAGNSEP